MGTALRTKQRLLSHVHSVEGQGRVTVPRAQCCWARNGYCSLCTVLRAKKMLFFQGTQMSVKLLAAVFCYV